jgi:glycosyltransferase involved in cell wall biosynthesis
MIILHTLFAFQTGGAETMLVDIINHQCKENTVSLLIIKDLINKDLLQTIDPRVSIFLLKQKGDPKLHFPSLFLRIHALVRKLSPDIIHCHDNTLFPFFIEWKQKTRITVHNVRLSTCFLSAYQEIFVISAAVRDDIKTRTGLSTTLIYNGIELPHYLPRTHYQLAPDETFNIVQVSRLAPEQKGQPVAIQAFRLLKEQYPTLKIKLHFVGAGDALLELQAMAAYYHLQNEIVFVGQKDRDWIKTHLRDYHLLIQPSLFEGFGLTIIEGFACGLPVIASDLDGPKEIVQLLNTGWLVPPDRPEALSEKIYQIYQYYRTNTLQDHPHLLADRQQLSVFDVRHTAAAYLAAYHHSDVC